jgi:hypothetical protein
VVGYNATRHGIDFGPQYADVERSRLPRTISQHTYDGKNTACNDASRRYVRRGARYVPLLTAPQHGMLQTRRVVEPTTCSESGEALDARFRPSAQRVS